MLKPKRDGVINPQNYNFNQFQHGKFGCSQNAMLKLIQLLTRFSLQQPTR